MYGRCIAARGGNRTIMKYRIEIKQCNLGCLGNNLLTAVVLSTYRTDFSTYRMDFLPTKVTFNVHQNLKYRNSIITIRDHHRIQFNVVEDDIQFNVIEDRTSDTNSNQIKYKNLRDISRIVHSKYATPTKIHSRLALQTRNASGKLNVIPSNIARNKYAADRSNVY